TKVPGIQISEAFPNVARQLDKISIVRSLRTEESNHGFGHHYVLTGHRPNPAMKFPSLGSVVAKELGARNKVPAYAMMPSLGLAYDESFKGHILGGNCDPLILPGAEASERSEVRPEIENLRVPDLALPNGVSIERLGDRKALLELVDQVY